MADTCISTTVVKDDTARVMHNSCKRVKGSPTKWGTHGPQKFGGPILRSIIIYYRLLKSALAMTVGLTLHLIPQSGRRHFLVYLPVSIALSFRPFFAASSFGLSSSLSPFFPFLVQRAQSPLNSACALQLDTHFAVAPVIADPSMVRLFNVPTLQRSALADFTMQSPV